MGRQLMSKAFRVNESGELLVNFSADRVGGAQVGRAELPPEQCVPFASNPPLKDRKYLLLTFTTDLVFIGPSPISKDTSYFSTGTNRGANGQKPPGEENYSNRKQFLRGQYLYLSLKSAVKVCAGVNLQAIEEITSLETS